MSSTVRTCISSLSIFPNWLSTTVLLYVLSSLSALITQQHNSKHMQICTIPFPTPFPAYCGSVTLCNTEISGLTLSDLNINRNKAMYSWYSCYFLFIQLLQIFGNVPASSMQEKFNDILQFCSHVSKLMVTEVRRRASNQSTGTCIEALVVVSCDGITVQS